MTIAIDEDNFVGELKNKNEDALYYVVDRYGGLIKTIVNRHLFYLEDHREECINDCLLAIWDNIDSYDEERDFKNWVAGIAKYKSIDYIRKYLGDRELENIDDREIADGQDSLDLLLEKEFQEGVGELLYKLSPEDRLIFKETYFRDRSARELAEDLDMKESNIYNRLSRGRERLRLLMGGKDNGR